MGLLFNRKKFISLPEREVHCHLLPGVDDGFRSAEDSLTAIRLMYDAGVRDITFTPHMNPDVYPDENEDHFRRVYAEFAPMVPEGMTTHLAAEYMVIRDFEKRAGDRNLLSFDDGSILIEMSYYFKSENIGDTIFALTSEGYQPILAHPERYLYLADSLHEFERYHDMGCRFQMNWLSLSGMYGPQSLKILNHLLEKGWYSFIATDLHSLGQLSRISKMKLPEKLLKKLPSNI